MVAKKVREDGQHNDPRQRAAENAASKVDVKDFLEKVGIDQSRKGGK